jgi:hypothetical protein
MRISNGIAIDNTTSYFKGVLVLVSIDNLEFFDYSVYKSGFRLRS